LIRIFHVVPPSLISGSAAAVLGSTRAGVAIGLNW
jgi:hypothetical protein